MEIIPKPKARISLPETIFLYFSASVFIFLVIITFLFWGIERAKTKEKLKIEEQISSLKASEKTEQEKEVLKYQKKIGDFSRLIKEFFFPSKIFPYLEKTTHKKVFLTNLDLDFEKSIISLSGEVPDFPTLAQQLEIWQKDPSLKAELKGISLTPEGKVEFKAEITFDKSILK